MTLLIYSKLDPASGNTTSADRLARLLAPRGDVIRRAIPPAVPDDPAASQQEVAALRQLAAGQAVDLVIGIHCYRAGALLQRAFAAADGPSVPYLLIASGTDLNLDLQNNLRHATLRDAMAHAAGVVALSPELHRRAGELLATLPAARQAPLVLIPQAPDIATASRHSLRATLGLAAEQPLVLLPAGIRPVKGIAFAIEAAAQALLDHPGHVLAILGPPLDADYHAHCASLIREWSLRHRALKGRLHLLPGLPRADYLAVLGETDLLLNTSESEAVSNAVLEALGAGVPVLARNIAGNRAVIAEAHNGLLFDRLPAFIRQYRRLFAEPGLRDRLVAAGRLSYRTLCDPAAEQLAYLALIDRIAPGRR